MQEGSDQSNGSNELTLPNINKALKRWMNKQDKTDIEEESNIIVSNALEVVYQELRRLFAEGENGIHFEQVMRIYIDLFQSAGNNKHRFFVEKHMKELLKKDSYSIYKRSQKYYDFFGRIFQYYPFLVFRLLQSQSKLIFHQPLEEVFRLYSTYIKFATSRKNFKLIDQYIQEELNSDHGSIDKMSILLESYVDNPGNIIKQNMLKQIIKLVMDYNKTAEGFEWNIKQTKMQTFCEILFKIQWSPSLQTYKSRFALSVIKKWESKDSSMPANKCINVILKSVQIDQHIRPQLEEAVRHRLNTQSTSHEHFGLNCEFTRIVLSKLTRADAENIISKEQYLNLSDQIAKSTFNREQSIYLLDVIREKEVFDLSDQIESRLIMMINNRLIQERGSIGDVNSKDKERHQFNLIFALKAIVIYKFKKFNVIYSDYKKLILRDNKIMKQSSLQLKTQCLKVCLHYLRFNQFEGIEQQRHAFRDIIELVGTALALKRVMIEYIVMYLEERFFDHSQIYMVYRENKYEYLLFEDFTTNELSVRIFSIKIISYLAQNIHQYRFFIKNAYKVLYDRLGIKGLLRSEQKLTALKLIRELMRYRGQIFQKQADTLAVLLIDELHKSIEFHSPQMNNISGYILRIFQALMRKLPQKMVRYVPCLARYAVDILNYRIIKKQLKKQTVILLCQMTDSCRYVILPYFHFPDLYSIIRQMLLADDHNYYYQDLMLRLIGRIGYIGYEEFMGLQLLNMRNGNDIEANFKIIFGETYFIKEYEKSKDTSFDTKRLIIEDVYYNESKMSNTSIEVQTYVEYIITTIINNLSLSIVETALVKSLETIINLIPVLESTEHQKLLHKHLLLKMGEIQQKYPSEIITIIDELLKYHDIESWCVQVLRFYLKKVYNHKRQDDIIRLICSITEKYADSVSSQLVNLIIVIKKIIIDSVEERKHEDKIRHCFTIIINMGETIDEVLHLFFTDIIKMFSYNYDKFTYDISSRNMDDIPDVILEIYLVFLMQLVDLCPSAHYFLPSIRQFLILYFNRQINKLKGRQGRRQLYYIRYEKKLLNKIVDAMIYMMIKYGKQCQSFIHLLHTSLRANRIHHKLYNIGENYLKKQSNLDLMETAFEEENVKIVWEFNNRASQRQESKNNKLQIVGDPKKKIIKEFQNFVLNPNHTVQQDELWLDNLALELFNNSEVDIIRVCGELAAYDKLFRFNLFEVPFYFFWKGLYEKVEPSIYTYDDFDNLPEVKVPYVPNQDVTRLTSKIRTILSRKEYSLKVRQKFLECIYFIERYQIPFMIKDKVLYDIAVAVQDSVKAMFYLEREYENDPDVYRQCLIERYAQIGLNESAAGLFKSLKNIDSVNKENIIKLSQKLGPSEEFIQELDSRRQKQKMDSKSKGQQLNLLDLELKRDICDWQSIYKIIEKENPKSSANKSKFAHFAIEAAVNLGQWEDAKTWVPYIQQQKKNEQLKVWITMLSIHSKRYDQAQKMISDIRENMNDKIRQMFSLSYDKSMKGVVILQQVSELEEIVHYERVNKTKKMQNRFMSWEAATRKGQLKQLWNDRLKGLKNNLYAMQKVMTVRSLLLEKSEDVDNQIRFCQLALREGQKYLARLTFKKLRQLGIKDKLKSLQLLCIELEIEILELVNTNQEAFSQIQENIVNEKLLQDKKSLPLVFEIYQKFAQRAIEEEKLPIDRGNKYLKIFKSFPTLKDYYQLSHYMGLLNIKLLEAVNSEQDKKKNKTERRQTVNLISIDDPDISKTQKQSTTELSHNQKKSQYMLGALRCFIKSVTFTQRENKFFLEDCLKILNLISMGHKTAKLIDELKANYMNIPRDGLIEIIPQLIARLDNQSPSYKDLMKDIIIYIGKEHPQILLFPLIYLKKGYKSQSKREIAEQLINKIAAHKGQIKMLFEKAEEIAEEICKISLKLSEKVFLFMKKIIKIVDDGKMERMALVQKLLQFCRNILTEHERPSSPTEFGFIQEQKSALFEVIQNLTLYKQLSIDFYFDEAISLIREIKQRTKETLSSIKTIYMEEASNKLFKISQSQVFLFGTYSPHCKNVTIDSFKNEIEIIHSKQRPKKIVIIGSDQKQYNYLIKGKQDLRLDQRIMQLFTFINKMFHSPSDKQSYSIQGYSITPISYEIGIIAWVQNCDTLGSLIQNYRRQNGVLVSNGKLESKLCRHIYPNYPDIEKYHKVEIYHEVCKQISGLDLKYILSKRSETSQKWLKYRSCFIRSLAVMSIVGYIIGLGDRHPFNIMIQRDTWKVVHIDFGDCFEVNKMRRIYPERVPFRLTRMLVNAMEACKTDGIFKHTCQKIMKILRMNKQSILVIVEAFRYDPLFGWKLTSSKEEKQGEVRLEHMQWEGVEAVMLDGEEQKQEKYVYLEKEIQRESTQHILKLIRNKLIGKENQKTEHGLSEAEQVNNLIKEAMNPLNLVQHFENWCIFW